VYRAFEVLLESALDAAVASGDLRVSQRPACRLEPPDDPAFGDATSRVAMLLARRLGRPATEVARVLAAHVVDRRGWLERVEAAGPGFLNVEASRGFWQAALAARLDGDVEAVPAVGRAVVLCAVGSDRPVAARAAIVAGVLERLLAAAGHAVERLDGPLEDLAACRAAGEVARAVVVHDSSDAGVARRAKAIFVAAGGRAGRLRGMPLAPLEVRSRGRLVDRAEAAAALARPAARFLVAGMPAARPAVVSLDALATARIDDPLLGIRYALTRIDRLPVAAGTAALDVLGDEERACLRGVGTHADVVTLAARRLEPEAVVVHACALAAAFHRYYNRGNFLVADVKVAAARRALADGVARVLQAALALVLGSDAGRA
jgi:arginyl-tRNA synthetase